MRPGNIGLPANSRVQRGKCWPRPSEGSVRKFIVYRYDPERSDNPRLDTYFVDDDDCGSMVLDALIRVYPLNHMPVIKDLVPDLTHAYAHYAAVEPWLKTRTPASPSHIDSRGVDRFSLLITTMPD